MLIRPMINDGSDTPVKEANFRSNTFKNDLYICPVDKGFDPVTGQLLYDVVLISEIIGDIPGANEYDPRDVNNLGKAFGKIVHHFSGRIHEGNVDVNKPNELVANMSLYPIISYVSSFKDTDIIVGSTQFYRYDTKKFTSVIHMLKHTGTASAKSKLDDMREVAKRALVLDIPDPLYPALRVLREYNGVPDVKVAKLDTSFNYGAELINNIVNLKIHMVEVDFAAEERARVERNNSIRALLGSPAADCGENDPLVDRITLGNMAKSIAVDFVKADLGGMMESCTLIFDNKIMQPTGLYCGFKSVVVPFGEIYANFNYTKTQFIAHEFDKICKCVIGLSTPRHFRVTIDCNQFEITVKVSILDEEQYNKDLFGLYDFKKSVTIKMKKSEAVIDFVTQFLHTQQMLDDYYKQ